MSHHDLNLLPCYFDAVKCGDKTFEIRNNRDRGFQKGDTITLHQLSKISPTLRTGHKLEGVITYVLNYEQKPDYVVFSFSLTEAQHHD